jgi:hypothetical protein
MAGYEKRKFERKKKVLGKVCSCRSDNHVGVVNRTNLLMSCLFRRAVRHLRSDDVLDGWTKRCYYYYCTKRPGWKDGGTGQ